MALNIKVEDGLSISVNQARTILQSETDKFGLFIDLDRCLEYELLFKLERDKQYDLFKKFTGPGLKPSQKVKVREWFQDAFDIPDRLFYNKANKLSFDKEVKKNLKDSNISDDAKAFLEVYDAWNYYSYRVNYLKQYFELPISYGVSDKGHRMVVARPNWSILSTSRLAADSPSLQNIAKDMKDIICCPEGWKLIRCDSGQIEPRITYSHYIDDRIIRGLILLYNDAYYGQLHYCQLPEDVYQNLYMYRVAEPGEIDDGSDSHVIFPKPITDEMVDGRKELKVLALAATYGSALAGRDPVLAKRYTDRIVNHPARKEWEVRVQDQVRRGEEVFYSVFGSKIEPEETDRYHRGTPSWIPHVIRCGINNPIQTTASDLMVCSVGKAIDIINSVEKSHIAYYKHDEGAFYVHESEQDIIKDLSDVTAYNVTEKGIPWIPIYADLEEGQAINEKVPTVLDWR